MAPAGRAFSKPSSSSRKRQGKIRRVGRVADLRSVQPPDLAARLKSEQSAVSVRAGRREALIDMVRAVNSTLDPAQIAALVLTRAANWVPAPFWAVVSADLSGRLSTVATRGAGPLADARTLIHEVAHWVIDHGEEFLAADLARDGRVTTALSATVVAFPMTCRDRRVGALIGLDTRPSSREPRPSLALLRAVRVLLEPVAVALDNAVVVHRAEALSVTDDLTGLFNSRFLNNVLRRETKRAHRSARPLSVLFVDLDGFKTVNDIHGHVCGSRALVEVAGVVRDSARETDLVARFGGDEFVLVLPETASQGASSVAERVRERIAAHSFLTSDGLDVRLTASVGIATMPDVAEDGDQLLAAADAAMYQVKDRGKNGIQAARVPADK